MEAIYQPRGAAYEYAKLACNLYRGCLHGCKYCYAPACVRRTPEDFHTTSEVRVDVLNSLEKDARKHARSEPVLFCFTSDAYQPNETGDTRTALQTMVQAGCRFQVLTKGGTRALRDLPLFQAATKRGYEHKGPIAFGTTLLFTNDADRQEWEPNAATVADRIEAIKQFHAAGIRTWVSIEPVIDPAQALSLIPMLSPWVDEWRVGKLNHHPFAKGIDWAGFAPRMLRELQACGRDYLVKDALRPFLPKGSEVTRYAKVEHEVEVSGQQPLFA